MNAILESLTRYDHEPSNVRGASVVAVVTNIDLSILRTVFTSPRSPSVCKVARSPLMITVKQFEGP